MHIAVVVLNYNGRDLLRHYLPSIVQYSQEADVWVIDNASTDDSVEMLKAEFPAVKLVVNKSNTGYAGGYNEGLRQISSDVYVLINSDVEVTIDWLKPIAKAFQNDPQLGAAQPSILNDKKRDHYEYAGAAGGFIDRFGYPFCRGRIFDTLESIRPEYKSAIDCFWASGACMFVRAEVFHEMEGFYAGYFAHMEEIDLCWRMQSAGYAVRCIGESTVYHLGGGTLDYQNARKVYLNFRNNLIMLGRNLPARDRFRITFIRMLLDGLSAVRFLLDGKFSFFSAVFRAHMDYYRHIPKIMSYRMGRKRKWRALQGRYNGSVVWAYFVRWKKRFSEIVPKHS
jgi:GT2 family glycosyltransferase